jgi:hypothetical protein
MNTFVLFILHPLSIILRRIGAWDLKNLFINGWIDLVRVERDFSTPSRCDAFIPVISRCSLCERGFATLLTIRASGMCIAPFVTLFNTLKL